jgi:hypothetical protein
VGLSRAEIMTTSWLVDPLVRLADVGNVNGERQNEAPPQCNFVHL